MTALTIGLFEGREAAQRVRGALVEAGCGEGAVTIFGQEAGDGLAQDLVERGIKAERARLYAAAVGRGGVLVAAEAEDADTDTVLAVMKRFDEKEPEELLGRGGEEAERVERAQSVEEELRVGKERTTAGKRLVSSVSEREVEKPVALREEEVEVELRKTTGEREEVVRDTLRSKDVEVETVKDQSRKR